jgi:predicted transcriptional regulator
MMSDKAKTTLNLDDDLWKQIRRLAVEEDTTASALTEEALQGLLERRRKAPVRTGRS